MINIPELTFHDGHTAPQLGFGVWQIDNDILPGVVSTALDLGYRSVDTAAVYENERGVGQGLRESDVPREDVFVTTKVWNTDHGHEATRRAFEASLKRLDLDYVDLYLIHWPVPKINQYVQAWETMIQLRDEGLARSIGVCNFNINHLQTLLDQTGVLPVVNQVELHLQFQQQALRDFHHENNIVTEAWSPLGQGLLWQHPTLHELASKHDRSVAQIMLRWHIQLGNMVIPKSVTPSRLAENLQLFDFELDDNDMAKLLAMDQPDGRTGPDPELFRLPKQS